MWEAFSPFQKRQRYHQSFDWQQTQIPSGIPQYVWHLQAVVQLPSLPWLGKEGTAQVCIGNWWTGDAVCVSYLLYRCLVPLKTIFCSPTNATSKGFGYVGKGSKERSSFHSHLPVLTATARKAQPGPSGVFPSLYTGSHIPCLLRSLPRHQLLEQGALCSW